MKVLVVENNRQNMLQLSDLLEKEGYKVLQALNGADALAAYRTATPDFICLDIMMPDMSGLDVCREIRKTDTQTPIVFISSKSAAVDKVIGLEIGGDDYIVKPFDIHEVTARIRAVARRCIARTVPDTKSEYFALGDLKVYPNRLHAERAGHVIELGLRDIKILRLFHSNKGNVIDRNLLLDHCWGAHIMPESRTVDWHISQLRKRVEKDPKNPQLIKTVHAAGYRYDDAVA